MANRPQSSRQGSRGSAREEVFASFRALIDLATVHASASNIDAASVNASSLFVNNANVIFNNGGKSGPPQHDPPRTAMLQPLAKSSPHPATVLVTAPPSRTLPFDFNDLPSAPSTERMDLCTSDNFLDFSTNNANYPHTPLSMSNGHGTADRLSRLSGDESNLASALGTEDFYTTDSVEFEGAGNGTSRLPAYFSPSASNLIGNGTNGDYNNTSNGCSTTTNETKVGSRSYTTTRGRLSRRLTSDGISCANAREGVVQQTGSFRAHSVIERRYRAGIQDKFTLLRQCVSSWKRNRTDLDSDECDNEQSVPAARLNKAGVLAEAVTCINELKEENELLFSQLEMLLTTLRRLGQGMNTTA